MARVTDKFEALNGKYTDARVRRYLTPKRIVATFGDVVDGECFLTEAKPQAAMRVEKVCTMTNTPDREKNAGILLDFGIEFSGSVRIYALQSTVNSANAGSRVLVRFGESVGEALTPLGERGTTNHHANRDFVMNVPGWSQNETNESGFRFVYIELLDDDAELKLEHIHGVFHYLDLEYKGSFQSNDELLNKIWNVSAYTMHLCMQEYIWDGIKRDRMVWIGDMHPEVTTALAVFGDCDVIRRSADFVRDETPDGEWMTSVTPYCLWWVLIHRDIYNASGDIKYLARQKDKLCDILSRVSEYVDNDGGEIMPPRRLLDWPNEANEKAKHAGIHALLKMALDSGAQMLIELGEAALAEKCKNVSKKMEQHIPDIASSKQAAALMVMSGLCDAKKLNDEIISVGGAQRFSTFFSYYILTAKAMACDYIGALDALREYYGGMLKMGATTFWEDFNIKWLENSAPIDIITPDGMNDIHGDFGDYCYKNFRHSLCHGWSSGACPYLSHYVLGIRPINSTSYIVKPELGDLEWVRGTYPTVNGIISVKAEKTADGIKVEYEAPDGITVITDLQKSSDLL